MDEEGLSMILLLVLAVLCIVFLIGVNSTEGIGNGTLDRVCKNITGDPSAKYYQEVGWQTKFPCKTGNEITLVTYPNLIPN